MSQPLHTVPSQLPTANEQLAAQIAAALRDADFITAADQDVAVALLATGNAKAGDWRRLLEKSLPATPTPIATNHAPAHHTA